MGGEVGAGEGTVGALLKNVEPERGRGQNGREKYPPDRQMRNTDLNKFSMDTICCLFVLHGRNCNAFQGSGIHKSGNIFSRSIARRYEMTSSVLSTDRTLISKILRF